MTKKEYKVGKGWAILTYIFAPLIIVLFVWLLIMPFVLDDISIEAFYFIAPVSVGMIGLVFVSLMDIIKGKVIVSHDTLSVRSTFINRDLKFQEIKGFQVERDYILVLPNTEKKKRIKITKYIGNLSELINWLNSNFPDLHQVNEEKQEAEILENFDYGRNIAERSSRLKKAKKIDEVLNWAGLLIVVWTLFKPEPYEYAILASMTLPVIAVLIVINYKGLIRIDETKRSIYPTLASAVYSTPPALMLRAVLDYDILDYSNIWLPSIIIGVAMMSLVLFGEKEFKFKKAQDYFSVLFLTIFFCGFGYGSIVSLNCMYDESVPQKFQSQVLDKRISSGRTTTTYYLELSNWGVQTETDKVSVSKELYENLEINDKVNIYLKEGRFEIPWFVVTE